MIQTMKSAAHSYIDQGWAVLPLKANSKDPNFNLIDKAYLSATKDHNLVDFWFNMDPNANLGIACRQSGLVVIDIDYRNGGELLNEMNQTYTVKTGGGLHLYYQAEQDMAFRGKIEEGIDIKFKGYVAAPPSIHPNGKKYEAEWMLPIAKPSQDLLELILQ